MKKRSARVAQTPDRVVWREGVQIAGTAIWCDAARGRELCFVSHAAVPHAERHRQIIASADTVALLPVRAATTPPGRAQSRLTPLFARPFSLGDLRVELYPSGFDRGAASLVVDVRGARVAYAGAVPPGLAGAAWRGEARACDAVILDATFSHPRHVFAPPAQAAAALDAFVAAAQADGATPVLRTGSETLALALCAHLGAGAGLPVAAHRGVAEAAKRRRALDAAFPAVRRLARALVPREVVIWPAGGAPPVLPAGVRARVALVDGTAVDADARARAGADTGVVWSDRAGHDDLLAYAAMCGASEVFALGGADEAFVDALAARKVRVRRLGPPAQLGLW